MRRPRQRSINLAVGAGDQSAVTNLFQRSNSTQIVDPNVTETDLVGAQGVGVTIPGGALGLGLGRVSAVLSGALVVNANVLGSITFRVRYGAVTLATETVLATVFAIASYRYVLSLEFSNLLTTGLQGGFLAGEFQTPEGFASAAAAIVGVRSLSGLGDSTAAQALRITAQFTVDFDASFSCSYAHVDLVRAA